MSQRKFILLSILKTWFMAAVISMIILIIYLAATKIPVQDGSPPRNCDMSGLAYGIVLFWILSLSLVSISSLFSLLKGFRGNIKRGLCWFALPVLLAGCFLAGISDGNIDKETVIFFLIADVPWFLIWTFYYYKFISLFK